MMNDNNALVTRPEGRGLALVAGTAVNGEQVGVVYWDTSGGEDAGYVLRIGDDESLPNDPDEMARQLAARGWTLTPESLDDVAGLRPTTA